MKGNKNFSLHFVIGLTSICFNIILLIILVYISLPPSDRGLSSDQKMASQFGKTATELLGMDIYCVKDPFGILVDKSFPHKYTFTILLFGEPLIISSEDKDENDTEATKAARISLGTDFTMLCRYSTDNGIKVHQLEVLSNNYYLIDLNADGHFDERMYLATQPTSKQPPLEIWYENNWQEVVRIPDSNLGKYERRLKNDDVVSFDLKTGVWLSTKQIDDKKD